MSMAGHGGISTEGKLLIRPPEFWQSDQQSSSSKAGGIGEGNKFGLIKCPCSYFEGIFNML
jgi:hypothetical protein